MNFDVAGAADGEEVGGVKEGSSPSPWRLVVNVFSWFPTSNAIGVCSHVLFFEAAVYDEFTLSFLGDASEWGAAYHCLGSKPLVRRYCESKPENTSQPCLNSSAVRLTGTTRPGVAVLI